jgi:RNA polymerase sigma-70 factor (ECF subfamily)
MTGPALFASESSARRQALRDPDVRLMLSVQDDDAEAFEELVIRYQSRLVTLLEHMVGSRDLAEDLAQEVFLRVYRARKRYHPGARFSTWLFTIANNVASNALRSQFRRREVSLRCPESGSTGGRPLEGMIRASSSQIPARQLDKAEMRDIIRLALTSLNERQRMAVLLCKFEGMSYADIAEAMDMSPQAIKSLLSRARVNLRAVLEPYLEYGERPALDGAGQTESDLAGRMQTRPENEKTQTDTDP